MSPTPTPPPSSIPDPSSTIPVDVPAAQFLAQAREDALHRALTIDDDDDESWQPAPAPRLPREWDTDTGTWSSADDVPDPSWVDADAPSRRDVTPLLDFAFPDWASDEDALIDGNSSSMRSLGPPQIIALLGLCGVATTLVVWTVFA